MRIIAGSIASVACGAALAQGTPASAPHSEEIIVTGTRGTELTESTSPVPVSVYDADELRIAGFPDLGRALNAVAPSINLPHSQTSPSAANTRSITMKGMAPDQVLVLINGKRWQSSAVLVFNNAVGRGSAPYDVGAIPLTAVKRIEVLSGTAAAQYGSDAIAGVVNIILNDSDHAQQLTLQSGVTDAGDGSRYSTGASQGFRIRDTGHLTLSSDIRYQDFTNRAVPDPRNGGRIDQQVGDPRAFDVSLAADAAVPLNDVWDSYFTVLGARRDSTSVPTFRLPGASVLYPEGYLPRVNPLIWNTTGIAGVRGSLSDTLKLDVSNSFGYSSAQFDVYNSANNALGAASPTQFDSGSLRYLTDTLNVSLDRSLQFGNVTGNIAGGVEHRAESYSIGRGEPLSYEQGGAQGFPGFAPRIPVNNSRNATSGYVDAELSPVHWLHLGAAGRYDDYSDFGDAVTWKASVRADLTDWFALRGSGGTGFRAPSLQQEYFSSVVSQINTSGALVRTGTYQVRDPIAVSLGAQPLEPERSHDYTAGLVLRPTQALVLTADFYRIRVADRVILSDQLRGPAVTAVLIANGITDVQQVQFFTNAAGTRTEGYEASLHYSQPLPSDNSLTASIQYGQFHTTLEQLDANPVLPTLPFLGTISHGLLISAQPSNKLTSALTFSHRSFDVTLDADHFGPWVSAPLGTTQRFDSKTIYDLSCELKFDSGLSIALGALNVTDVYPDLVNGAAAIGLSYGDEAPFGVNGRSYFINISLRR
jgi:iron complex outermembrane recepter protein